MSPEFLLQKSRKARAEDVSMQIAEATSLENSTRQLAAEFLVTLCEAREKAPGMMRKLPEFIGRLFQCLLNFLLDIEVRTLRPACAVLGQHSPGHSNGASVHGHIQGPAVDVLH